jgi:hypothetical protein
MIIGRFGDTTGRPYVEGRLVIPSQSLSTDISFILDTGADRTVLMPMDGAKIGLDYSKLGDACQSLGVGGYSSDFQEDAVLIFLDHGKQLCFYTFKLIVSAPAPEIGTIPSLLGRNIIDRWRVIYDPVNDLLEADPHSADLFNPIA